MTVAQVKIAQARGDVVLVDAVFANHVNGDPFTFFCVDTLAKGLRIDSLAVADTAKGPQIVVIRSIYPKLIPTMLKNDIEYRYVFDIVDTNRLGRIVEENQAVLNKTKPTVKPDQFEGDLPEELDFLS